MNDFRHVYEEAIAYFACVLCIALPPAIVVIGGILYLLMRWVF